jgi:hypothetical protein
LSILKNIAIKLKGHDCDRMVKRIGNEISLTLPTLEGGIAKINIGLFSNRIVELVKASNIAVVLDNSQYLICKVKTNTNDPDLKLNCEKIYLQIIFSLTQLESLFETIKVDPNPEMRKELIEWIKYSGSLTQQAIEAISPGTSGKGPEDYEIKDIMRYQNITEDEMKETLQELKEDTDTSTF